MRVAGQDTRRGTFSQRHAVLVDFNDEHEYTPLGHISPDQAPFMIYDSVLSEFAALGFEYGYSVADPDTLVCWEAQFGDFGNGGQTIIDQFIVAAEDKWGQLSGLVLLLPHGFEGQGPEHSSARLERFLTLCADDNMRVTYPTTAAQYFHVLRRQVLVAAPDPVGGAHAEALPPHARDRFAGRRAHRRRLPDDHRRRRRRGSGRGHADHRLHGEDRSRAHRQARPSSVRPP